MYFFRAQSVYKKSEVFKISPKFSQVESFIRYEQILHSSKAFTLKASDRVVDHVPWQ